MTHLLADEVLLQVFQHLVWLRPSEPRPNRFSLLPGWRKDLMSAGAVCRRWRRVSKDDFIWRRLHVVLIGTQRLRELPWVPLLAQASRTTDPTSDVPSGRTTPSSSSSSSTSTGSTLSTLSRGSRKRRGSIMKLVNLLLSHRCCALITRLLSKKKLKKDATTHADEQSDVCWHASFMVKAPEINLILALMTGKMRCVIQLGRSERWDKLDPENVGKRVWPQDQYVQFKRAVLLGCNEVVRRLQIHMEAECKLRQSEACIDMSCTVPYSWSDSQLLQVAAVTDNRELVTEAFVKGYAARTEAALMALELGLSSMLGILIADGVNDVVNPKRKEFPYFSAEKIFKAACKLGQLDDAKIAACCGRQPLRFFAKHDKLKIQIKAAEAGHWHIVKFLCENEPVVAEETLMAAIYSCNGDVISYFITVMGCSFAKCTIRFHELVMKPEFTFDFLKLLVDKGQLNLSGHASSHNALFSKWPLSRANEEVCRYLVHRGANINAPGMAVRHDDLEHARCLIRCGARPERTAVWTDEWIRFYESVENEVSRPDEATQGRKRGIPCDDDTMQEDNTAKLEETSSTRPAKRVRTEGEEFQQEGQDDSKPPSEADLERRIVATLKRQRSSSGWKPNPGALIGIARGAAQARPKDQRQPKPAEKLSWHFLKRLATTKCGIRPGAVPSSRLELLQLIHQRLPPDPEPEADHSAAPPAKASLSSSSSQQEETGELAELDDDFAETCP